MDADAVTRLRRIISQLARHLNASSTGEGLTPSQASVLALIVARGPLGLGELTELEGLNPTMLSRVVGRLDELDLIRRTPCPPDMRTVSVESTPDGQRTDERIKQRRAAVVSQCIEQLTAKQVTALVAALPALEALADQLRRTSAPP